MVLGYNIYHSVYFDKKEKSMKPIYIYASRLGSFWVLLPMSVILTLAIRLNGESEQLLKLYPLIIFCIGAIIFTFVYLFRFIAISYSEI